MRAPRDALRLLALVGGGLRGHAVALSGLRPGPRASNAGGAGFSRAGAWVRGAGTLRRLPR
ncbi:hypothetical protein E6U81_34615 [Streptomyces sp. A0592]|nr:hypothetical protein E6U81_34615 [Streptomyces sp. A0592]